MLIGRVENGTEKSVPTGTESRINRLCTVLSGKNRNRKKRGKTAVTGMKIGEGVSVFAVTVFHPEIPVDYSHIIWT